MHETVTRDGASPAVGAPAPALDADGRLTDDIERVAGAVAREVWT